jgi:adenosylhomocysteine nucleosidase
MEIKDKNQIGGNKIKPMKILVLAPMKLECNNFKNAIKQIDTQNEYKVVECGIGKVNAASIVTLEILNTEYDLVAVIGYAAASGKFELGDVVIPNKTCYHDTRIDEGIADELLMMHDLSGPEEVTILTGDCFVNKDLSESLQERFGDSVIFDMETCAIAQICSDYSIPVMAIKLISDIPTAGHNERS